MAGCARQGRCGAGRPRVSGKVLEGVRGAGGAPGGGRCFLAPSRPFPDGFDPGFSTEGKREPFPGCCFQLGSPGMKENSKNGAEFTHSLVDPLWGLGVAWAFHLNSHIIRAKGCLHLKSASVVLNLPCSHKTPVSVTCSDLFA